MWTKRLPSLAFACCALTAMAEPRIAGMDAALEATLARGNYLFVWDLDMATIGRGDPYRTWRTYYDGIMYALSEERRLIEPGTPAKLNLEPVEAAKGWAETYRGTLVSNETYLEGARMEMHVEVTRRDCDRKRAQLFFALSYSPPESPEWNEMRKTRDGISCDKSKN